MVSNTPGSVTRVNSCDLLFNIFINDIFYFIQGAYLCNFADDNSLYSLEDNFKEVKTIWKKNFELLQRWFYENHIVQNPERCHYLVINRQWIYWIRWENFTCWSWIDNPWFNNRLGFKLSKSHKVDHRNS